MSTQRKNNQNERPTHARQSNLELFRIILMLLIIAHHYVVNSGLSGLIQGDPTSKSSIFLLSAGAFGKIAINCFVLITGYFMCKSHITLKKFLKFILEVIFYYVVIYLLFCFLGGTNFSLKELLLRAFPIKSIASDFTSAYVILFLLIPFINILVKNLNKYQHLALLVILIFVYTLLGSIEEIPVLHNYVSWFFVVYLVGSFIRLYPGKLSSNLKFWGVASVASLIACIASIFLCISTKNHTLTYIYYYVIDSNKILAVISSISLFMLFKNIPIRQNKFINYLAASTFGVLLIHASGRVMVNWLWNVAFKNPTFYGKTILPLHLLVAVISVYSVCIIIDKARIKFLEKPLFTRLDANLNSLEKRIKKLTGFTG